MFRLLLQWYVITLAGARAGSMHEIRATTDNGLMASTAMRLTLNRLGHQIIMETSDDSWETTGGTLTRADGTQRLSEQATAIHATVAHDSLRVVTVVGGRSFTRIFAVPVPLLGPVAAERLTNESLRRPGDSVTYHVFASSTAEPATVTRTLVALDTVRHSREILERSTASPMPVTIWIDATGTMYRSVFTSPFGAIASNLADSASAVLANAGGELPDEMFSRTLVPTGVRLPQARRMAMLRLAVTTDTSVNPSVFEGSGQHVESHAPGRIVLQITRRYPPPGLHPFPVAPTDRTRQYLVPNGYIQSDQPALHTLALRIIGHETDAWKAALALERWVSDSMHFDLGIVFAPSVEVLARRRGTCIAYSTLLAALTRTLGIPSRVAFGYGYVNGIFGGHAWPEVLIGGGWVPLDAALVSDGSADAARIAFRWGSLAGGPSEFTNSAGAQLYGAMHVRVLTYQVEGQPPVTLDSGTAPYAIEANTYSNPSLGFALTAPKGFAFIELDDTWPSTTIAGMTTPAGDTVRIHSFPRDPWTAAATAARSHVVGAGQPLEIDRRAAWIGRARHRAVLAMPNGCEILTMEATGPDAYAVLRRATAGLHFRQSVGAPSIGE